MEIIISSALTIVGWIIAAYWAVKQVKLSHEKNIELQKLLIIQVAKDSIVDKYLDINYKIIFSIINFRKSISDMSNNIGLHNSELGEKIRFSWEKFIPEINNKYESFCLEMGSLEIWLECSGDYIENKSDILEILNEYNKNFTTFFTYDNPWLNIQKNFIVLQTNENQKFEKIMESLINIDKILSKQVEQMKKCSIDLQNSLLSIEKKSI